MAKLEKYKKAATAGDNEFTGFVNYSVKKKVAGKYKLSRVLMICAYILVDLLYASVFLVLTKAAAFVMFVPLLTWMMVYFTWPFVNIEYEYTVVGGTMTARKVYGMRYSEVICEFTVSSASRIAPYSEVPSNESDAVEPARRFFCASALDSPDLYLAVFNDKSAGLSSLTFEATEKTLRILKYYTPNITLAKTRY